MVPEGLKPRECECVKLHEPPPVPYVPKKDEVQDEVARMQSLEIKTMIEKDTTLNFAVWQENGTREAFFDARNCGTQCYQEMWSCQGLRDGCEGI